MKNKLFLAFAAVLFAAITLFNVNLAQQQAAGDITLAGVEMVAGAVDHIGDDPPHIQCHQFCQTGRNNQCWLQFGSPYYNPTCYFTGNSRNWCSTCRN